MNDGEELFRKVANAISASKSGVLGEIKKVDGKVEGLDKKVDMVREDMVGLENRLTKRIDKIGLNLARLEDDTPTLEEFDKLQGRVTKVEEKVASI